MAKINFNKLGLKGEVPIKIIEWNGQNIEVKQHLPLMERISMIEKIINLSVDENNYYNPCKIEVYKNILILENYTNINFTDKQKEDVGKLYDAFYLSGLLIEIVATIPKAELDYVNMAIEDTIKSVYAYKNSAMGILNLFKEDYKNVNFDVNALQDVLQGNSEELSFLRDVLNNLG